MTSRERVLTALEHRKPDRPPLNYFGTAETTAKLLKHLGLGTREELLGYLGADMRYVGPRYVGPAHFCGESGYEEGGLDVWGIEWRPIANDFCSYNDIARHPLAEAGTLADLKRYAWPSPDWFAVDHLRDEIRRFHDPEPRAIVLPTGHFFESSWFLRGLEPFLMDLVERPDMAEFVLMKVTGFYKELTLRSLEAADGGIDIVWSSSDIGMQTGMIVSPELWRRHLKPWHRELLTPFKRMGLKTRYHSDGGFIPVIEDLIEMGLDLLDPIQPKAAGMDADNLRRLFGGRLSFYGGMDSQELLPFGSAAQVEAEALRLIRVLGESGGYVVAASNAIQPDVPVENILAMFRAAREYRY